MEQTINIDNNSLLRNFLGIQDENIKIIGKHYPNVKITSRGNSITLYSDNGHDIQRLKDTIQYILKIVDKNYLFSKDNLDYILMMSKSEKNANLDKIFFKEIPLLKKGKAIYTKTINQYNFINSIYEKDITFGIGPAGTGKTFLAIAAAVNFLKNKDVSRIVLVRPVVEAGESLGFLPGDINSKIDPYLRPMYDALHDTVETELLQELFDKNVIEIVPLAYMRGRTLSNSFIVLDEAQNSSINQMKMFLTRLGINSRAVITGDITQIDLQNKRKSGLIHAANILNKISKISFVYFKDTDILRHKLIKDIVDAYESNED